MPHTFCVLSAYSLLFFDHLWKEREIILDLAHCVVICAVTQWEKRCVMFQITVAEDGEDF